MLPESLAPAVETWVWPFEELPPVSGPTVAALEIEVSDRPVPNPPRASPPTFDARYVAVWLDPVGAGGELFSTDGEVSARIDADGLRATVRVSPGAGVGGRHAGLSATLRVCTALLLARQGRALFHASAVVSASGGAWLFVGDSHSGKTTTALTLIEAGYDYLADDQLVVHADAAGVVRATGWPRKITLDEGYRHGISLGRRAAADPREFGPGSRMCSAPVAGLIFPVLEPGLPTTSAPIGQAETLTRLIRHSPWLLADRAAAGTLLRLLNRLATVPARSLRLGEDVFRRAAGLVQHLPEELRELPEPAGSDEDS